MTPLQAPTQDDPYGYYAQLRQQDTLFFDPVLGLWIASGAEAVEAILEHPECRVRPLDQPIPPAIAQGAAGAVFGRLMRMNEGGVHQCPRRVFEPALTTIELPSIAAAVSRVASTLDNPCVNPDELMFTLPACVIAHLLGLPCSSLHRVAKLTRDFAACLSPLSDQAQLDKAHQAASQLGQMFMAVLSDPDCDSPLLARICSQSKAARWDDKEALIANLIGLLSQTCEATAGLIGNTLIALHRNPDLIGDRPLASNLAAELIAEVARHDSPVQNTRRFVASRCTILGRVLEAGDTLLVILASANRDPCANPDPDRFLLGRSDRRLFSFGSGRHECPGQQLALTIAAEAIGVWLHHQPLNAAQAYSWRYVPSLNGRIPKFHTAKEAHL